ncbi:ThiF family adenylyltransferase [Halomonas sp. LBP4]|uniref:ThiF family adenylyltransferase n=1 Tax=Halomonas sp. LBP4 TaxID=2044917 RepID=UPI0015E8A661|nr:ThiF family adenylyltransferase [Halomonas sp. LBP4]
MKAAANDELLITGDPFELPVFPNTDLIKKGKKWVRVAFQENSRRLLKWNARDEVWGMVPLHPVAGRQDVKAAGDFEDGQGNSIISASWGEAVDQRSGVQWAAWLRLPAPPVMSPWAAPQTWSELAVICQKLGIDLNLFISQLSRWGWRETLHYVLVGFPIPDHVGGEDVQIEWKAIRLERPISRKMQVASGFRIGPRQLQMQVQLMLGGNNFLNWQPTENWETQVLNARGAFKQPLRKACILAVGGGAVGSKITETLARGGCEDMTIADPDTLEAGNLRRHTLLLSSVDQDKARALSIRLNQISPYMNAVAFPAALPTGGEGLDRLMRNTDLVLDMTAEDSVLSVLSIYSDFTPRTFISISSGHDARRLFFYAYKGNNFPLDDFNSAIDPWLEREMIEREAEGTTMGVPSAPGCWHPLFPARDDSLQILAGAATRMIERFYAGEISSGLHVLELQDDAITGLPTLMAATL